MNHSDRAHAILAPSSMDRAMTCLGGIILSEGLDEESVYAKEGSLAHEIAEELGKAALEDPLRQISIEKYDSQMIYHGREYASFISRCIKNFKPTSTPKFEQRVHFSKLIWGTADFFALRARTKYEYDLLFIDYKYGKGVKVSPENNSQLKTYIAAFVKEFSKEVDAKLRKAYTFIYQPRIPSDKPYSRHDYTGEEIEEWSDKLIELEKKYVKAKKNPEEYIDATGLKHCFFCPLRKNKTCTAYMDEKRKKHIDDMDSE